MKQVREGYKMTELGEIPQEWEVKRLGEISNKSNKYSFTGGPFGSDLKSCHYTDFGVRVIQLQNIGDGSFINNYFVYTSEEKANELLNCNIFPGDIIIAKMASPVARACIIPWFDERYLMASDGIRLAVDDLCDPKFITYSINSNYFRKTAIENSTGSTRLRIGLNELKNINILIPPLPEQKKIASILSKVDEQIELTDNLIEKTKDLKKGLMQNLLTKGIGHTEFKETEIGKIPTGWEVKKIKDISTFCSNGFVGTASSYYTKDNGTPYLMSNNIRNNKIDERNIIRITDEFQKKNPRSRIYKGDMLTVQSGHIGTSCIVPAKYDNTSCHALIITRFIKDKIEPIFISYYLNSNRGNSRLSTIFVGTTIKHINVKDLVKFSVPVPPLPEQKKIASILSSVDNQIEEYQNKKSKLEELKKGLMQQLLTGKIRVKVDSDIYALVNQEVCENI